MISEDIFAIRRYLENRLNTYSKIDISTVESIRVVEQLQDLEERIIALENGVVKDTVSSKRPKDTPKIVWLDAFRIKKENRKC
jgi:hypothetical protein